MPPSDMSIPPGESNDGPHGPAAPTGDAAGFEASMQQAAQERAEPAVVLPEATPGGAFPRLAARSMLALATAVYDGGRTPTAPFRRVSDGELAARGVNPALFSSRSTGLHAEAHADPAGHVVVVFAGTDPRRLPDIMTNLQQALGATPMQYRQAAALAQAMQAAYGADLVGFTGHSLGGGLATLAALLTKLPAVTFNPPGVSDATLRQLGLDPAAARRAAAGGQVRNYVVQDEWVDAVQGHPLMRRVMPQPPGTQVRLDSGKALPSVLQPIAHVLHRLELHMPKGVAAALPPDATADPGSSPTV